MSKRSGGYVLLFPDQDALALMKDKHFDDISDDEFRRVLLYNGFVNSYNELTEWSKGKGLFGNFLGIENIDGTFDVNPDRFSPKDSLLMISPKGIKYLRAIIEKIGRKISFGSLMDSQMAT